MEKIRNTLQVNRTDYLITIIIYAATVAGTFFIIAR